jgi:Tol biopolymer transport system component
MDIGYWKSQKHKNEQQTESLLTSLGLHEGQRFSRDFGLKTDGRNFTNLTAHTSLNTGKDSDPDISNDGRWLLFSSTRGGPRNDIWMKELGTNRVTLLTQDPGEDIHPKFSPDGRSVAFASNRHESNFDIYVLPLFNRHGKRIHATPIQITSNSRPNIHPSWSPDGRKLVYCSYNEMAKTWELWIYDHLDKSNSMIGYGLLPEWSPDGKHIVYEKFRNRDKRFASIWVCDPDGSNPSEIIGDRDYGAITPSWSPDGKYIAYATVHRSASARSEGRVNKGDNIWYISSIGGTPVQVTQYEGPDSQPVWKYDNKGISRIFFVSTRENNLEKIWSAVPFTAEDLEDFE